MKIYSISDYLFYKKLAHFKKNEEDIMNPYCWVSDEGIELYSSFSLINEGKLLNANLFNNSISGVFQIIVGIIAVLSIIMNYQDSKIYNERVSAMQREVNSIQLKLTIVSKEKLIEKNYSSNKKDNQAKTQNDNKK